MDPEYQILTFKFFKFLIFSRWIQDMAFPEFGFLDIFQQPGMRNPMRMYNISDAKHLGILTISWAKYKGNPIEIMETGNVSGAKRRGIFRPFWAKYTGNPMEII